MGQKVVTMDVKYAAVFADAASGTKTVTAVCAELGISRQTYYVYKRRFTALGIAGLIAQSRRPFSNPNTTSETMCAHIIGARKELEQEGWDNGARSIHARLLWQGIHTPPAVRTIHRVLTRAGMISPQPRKRPRASYRRFQFPATDDCWQIDAFEFTLATGDPVVVFQLLDDHSRYDLADLAWPREDTEGAWQAMALAIKRYGQPRMLLSDNGLAFTAKHLKQAVLFERNLARLGVKLITTRAYHPQTNGKNERGHRTLRKWLKAQPPPARLTGLQTLLERYRSLYNNRPHQGIDGATPTARRAAGTRTTREAMPGSITLATESTADGRGNVNVNVDGVIIPLKPSCAGRKITTFITGDNALLFDREHLARDLTIDRTRKRQPPIRPRLRSRQASIGTTN